MNLLAGKKILLGVTGSIAAYKSAYLVRLLVQSGAQVKVMMSPGALEFVTPLTFSSLSGNAVASDFTEDRDKGTWTNHVHLALWADLLVMAPCSANTLSKMATGQSDNFLLTTYMSARCPVMFAPAMDHDMFLHPGTQANIDKLVSFGHELIQPAEGALASGLVGKGRMAEPEEIYERILKQFLPDLPLAGKTVLITAGPTYELIDPVRFIGNFSTGKMGFALASEFAAMGAEVHLVSGPSKEQISHPKIKRVDVISGSEMFAACQANYPKADIVVFSAAVADYKPLHQADQKIKKAGERMTIELEKTIDIAATFGAMKGTGKIHVGFALETENEMVNGTEKLQRKNFDLLVLNSLRDEGAGFGKDTNKITLIWPGNKTESFGLKSKSAVARDIAQAVIKLIKK